jgi:hypothetical protein
MSTGLLSAPVQESLNKFQGRATKIALNDVSRVYDRANVTTRGWPWPGRVSTQSMMGGYFPDKPSTDMLRAMEMPDEKTDSRTALAIEAEDLLGYTPLRKETGAPSKLQRILFQLDIPIFDIATVDAYKLKMQQHHQAIASAKDKIANDRFRSPNSNPDFIDGFYVGISRQQSTEVSWSMLELKGYDKPIPEFVLRKCAEIKRHAPDANFYVDELRENARTVDPFMVVTLDKLEFGYTFNGAIVPMKGGADLAYIEVWDEPEFEKTL